MSATLLTATLLAHRTWTLRQPEQVFERAFKNFSLHAIHTDNGMPFVLGNAGETARFPLRVHPHLLLQVTGYFLANTGHGSRPCQD